MDPVTSPLIHKDSGRLAHVDPGEKDPSPPSSGVYPAFIKRIRLSRATLRASSFLQLFFHGGAKFPLCAALLNIAISHITRTLVRDHVL